MVLSPSVSPRRLTGKEETEVVRAMKKIEAAQARTDHLVADLERLVLELCEGDKVRVGDVASVLGRSRTTIHAMMERARRGEG